MLSVLFEKVLHFRILYFSRCLCVGTNQLSWPFKQLTSVIYLLDSTLTLLYFFLRHNWGSCFCLCDHNSSTSHIPLKKHNLHSITFQQLANVQLSVFLLIKSVFSPDFRYRRLVSEVSQWQPCFSLHSNLAITDKYAELIPTSHGSFSTLWRALFHM